MRLVDLHAHTNASDGSMTPTELVTYAKEKGLAAIAVTDHDTVAGLDEAMRAGEALGVEVVPGIETTTVVDGCDVHIVCLYFDRTHPAMTARFADLAKSRDDRNRAMVQRLHDAGLNIQWADFAQWEGRSIARGHIAQILIARGYASSLREAIANYMSPGTPGYVARKTPTPKAFISAVHEAGGVAFIAHINQIDRENWPHAEAVCREVILAGADGLETLYCEYDDTWRARAESLRNEYNLLASGGSDFHGTIKPGLDLGSGYGDLKIDYAVLDAIKKYISR